MLEIGKLYTNSFANKFKCLEIIHGKVVFWVFKELPRNNGLVAVRKDGQREEIRTISLIMIQDIKYAYQYIPIDDPEEIDRISKIYERETFKNEKRLRQQEKTWIHLYKIRRYLEHVSETELKERLLDILNNAFVLKENGDLVLRSLEGKEAWWLERLIHIEEEYRLRGISDSKAIDRNINLPKFNYTAYLKDFITSKGEVLKFESFIIKYGESQFMKPMFEEGKIQIKPASKYTDPSLASPIKDNELSRTTYGIPSEVKIEGFDRKKGEKFAIKPLGNVSFMSQSITDYFVYCVSCVYDPRMFKDRDCNYDSCVIIKDPFEFEKRLEKAFKTFYPEWSMFKNRVNYMDPFLAKDEEDPLFFTKNFKYAYQYEFRFIWLPPSGKIIGTLDPINLNLGSLKDIAELIIL
ncbi:MAG: hypothetical protein WC559_02265 [Candidatus Omnitrophota bacterium]